MPASGRSIFYYIAPVANRLTWLNWCVRGAFGDMIQVEYKDFNILKFSSYTGNHGLSIQKL